MMAVDILTIATGGPGLYEFTERCGRSQRGGAMVS